jgi:hypothetical protein
VKTTTGITSLHLFQSMARSQRSFARSMRFNDDWHGFRASWRPLWSYVVRILGHIVHQCSADSACVRLRSHHTLQLHRREIWRAGCSVVQLATEDIHEYLGYHNRLLLPYTACQSYRRGTVSRSTRRRMCLTVHHLYLDISTCG